jgi:hypothetical protein
VAAFDLVGSRQNGIYLGNIDKDDTGPPASLIPYGAGTAAEFQGNRHENIAVAQDAEFEVACSTVHRTESPFLLLEDLARWAA